MIEIAVNNQEVEFTTVSETVENSENLYTAHFTFSDDWSGFIKYAVFKNMSCENEIQVKIPATNIVLIPNEILKTQGVLKIGVYGYNDEIFKPTLYSSNAVLIKRGVNVNADNPHGFTPSEFFKLLTKIDNVNNVLTNHINNYNNPHEVTKNQIGLSKVENKNASEILAELLIGGTQILRNTQTSVLGAVSSVALWRNGEWRKASGTNGTWESIEIADCPEPYIEKGWRISSIGENTSTMQLITITQNNIPLVIGQIYVISCYARGKGTLLQSVGGTPVTAKYTEINHTDWRKYELAFTAQGSTSQSVYFGVRYQGDIIEVCGMKLEIGNRSTAWNMCPKDIAEYGDRIKALEASTLAMGGEI